MAADKPLKLLWAFPCGAAIDSEWFHRAGRYFDRTKHYVSMPLPGNQSGTLDLARSFFIDVARDSNPDWLIQTDDDVVFQEFPDLTNPVAPYAPMDRVVDFLEECREDGFDAVAGLLQDTNGKPKFGFTDSAENPHAILDGWLRVDNASPFEIGWSGMGFFAMSRKCFKHLKVIDHAVSAVAPDAQPGAPAPKPQNMFCKMNLPKEGEDASLCRNIRESGFRIAGDPRIPVREGRTWWAGIHPNQYGMWRESAQKELLRQAGLAPREVKEELAEAARV